MPQSTSPPTEPRPAPGRARPQRPGAPEKKQVIKGDRGRDRADTGAPPGGWVVYLLRCADGTIYCGCTNDLTRRLGRHQRGDVKYTRGRLPVEVAYSEQAVGRGEALRREAALKRLPRGRKLHLCATQAEPGSRPSSQVAGQAASQAAAKTTGKPVGKPVGKTTRKTRGAQADKPRSAARKL